MIKCCIKFEIVWPLFATSSTLDLFLLSLFSSSFAFSMPLPTHKALRVHSSDVVTFNACMGCLLSFQVVYNIMELQFCDLIFQKNVGDSYIKCAINVIKGSEMMLMVS